MMTHKNNDLGLSEVIGFILILALVISAISIWMTYVLPAQGRELEISHMDYVGDWFLDYKIAVDSLWMNNQIGVTDSTSLTLGSKGGNTQTSGLFLPMMQPIGSSGLLAINNTNTLDTITVTTSNNPPNTINMSSLTYQSNNNYWIQQQYYYQMGGIFLSQDVNGATGATNIVSPLISIYNVNSSPSVEIDSVQLNGGGTIAGEGKARVNFRLQNLNESYFVSNHNRWVTISVNVKDYPTAIMWRNLFRDIVTRGPFPKTWYPDEINRPNPGVITQSNRAVAYINITPPVGTDVDLVIQQANFSMSLNSIASV